MVLRPSLQPPRNRASSNNADNCTVEMPTVIFNAGIDDVLLADTMMMVDEPPMVEEADLLFYEEAAAQPHLLSHDNSDPDLHLLMSTHQPDNYTSYEELAHRYKSWIEEDCDDVYLFDKN